MAKSRSTPSRVSSSKRGKRKPRSTPLLKTKLGACQGFAMEGFGPSGRGRVYGLEKLPGLNGETWTLRVLPSRSDGLCVWVVKKRPKQEPEIGGLCCFNQQGQPSVIADTEGFFSIPQRRNRSKQTDNSELPSNVAA